jgi:hypothetical protein
LWGRKREEIIWTDCVKNKEEFHRVRKERNNIYSINRKNANWVGHILRRNCLLKHVIERKMERYK